jgi:hypothetical protein
MLKLHRAGLIQLPPSLKTPPNFGGKIKPPAHTKDGEPKEPITQSVSHIMPINLELVTNKTSKLWNEFMDRYHYLDFSILKGAQLRYFVQSSQGYVGAIGFSSAAWKTKARDDWIGWEHDTRVKNLQYIVDNARFLIFPWVHSKNLASKILGLCARQLPTEWKEKYGYKPVLFETFVEKQRFKGTCYKAANWICVGQTKGRCKWEQKGKSRTPLPIKDIFVYPLQKNFRAVLTDKT